MPVWLEQQEHVRRGSPFAFDKQAATQRLSVELSPWTEQELMGRRHQIRYSLEVPRFVAILFMPLLFLACLLWCGVVRRAAAAFLIVFFLIALPSFVPEWYSSFIVPGTHAFLDDYIYLSDVDLLHPSGKIAAFDWKSFKQDWWRVIAFDDGRVEFIDIHSAKALFEQQGIPYPSTPGSKQ